MVKKREISARAKRVWQRLQEWYGARLIESYGEDIPADWAKVIDGIDNDAVKKGLSRIRTRYVQHPPTLPQFEQVMQPDTSAPRGPSATERLCRHVMRHYGGRLTAKQIRGPWTYIGSPTGEHGGVVIDPDGDHPGYRVMLADTDIPDFKPEQPTLSLV